MSEIALKKGKLSSALRTGLQAYYAKVAGVDPTYVSGKWRQWTMSPDVVVYHAGSGDHVVGWIVYNRAASTVLDILVNQDMLVKEEQRTELLTRMMDMLIRGQSLVSAEILKADEWKYRWLVEYGFRPTRSFVANGFPFLKMDLSTSVLIGKTEGCKPAKIYRKKEKVAIEKVAESKTYE